MKFVRFGSPTLQRQDQYKEPVPDMWPSYPPRKKGFFAFPAGYMDPFYLPLSRPPEDPHSLLQYLRDDDGAKLTRRDLYDEPDGSSSPVLSERGRALLKKRRLREKQLFWIDRPSYVMFFADPQAPPEFYGCDTEEEDRGRLDRPVEFLLDPDGEKIEARNFFYPCFRELFPENYEGFYYSPEPEEDFNPDRTLYYGDGKETTVVKWLKAKNILPDQLCIWPVYPKLGDQYAGTLKKYRTFEYDGCLWHHLGALLKRSEILAQFSDTWYYTDIHAYERALAKADGRVFRKKLKYQRQMKDPGYFGAHEWNGTFDLNQMYEVFFDRKIS